MCRKREFQMWIRTRECDFYSDERENEKSQRRDDGNKKEKEEE
jgi:hypothetical protein